MKLSRKLVQNAASAEESRIVLVVEDHSLVRRATCEFLAHSGHHALEALNAAMARALFAQNAARIDAVVCDAVLPDASGIELCRFFQRGRAQLPIILTSGYPNSSASLERDAVHDGMCTNRNH